MQQMDYAAVELANPDYHRHPVSATFHGRDIFAPAAAYLCKGVALEELGPKVDALSLFSFPRPSFVGENLLHGEIIHVDRFGNVVSNIRREDLDWERATEVHVGGQTVRRFCLTYGEGEPGELLALVGSSGYVEVAARGGSAAERLQARVGDSIRVRLGN
jgi:S-adenosylmethionine hydrolase